MIDDAAHDLAIEYLFGSLEGDAQREFEAWIQSDPELRKLVDDLRAALAAVAHAAPPVAPPPALRSRILALPSGDVAPPPVAVTVPSAPAPRAPVPWLPWAIAAGLAVVAGFAFLDRGRWRSTAQRVVADLAAEKATAETARDEVTSSAERQLVAETQIKNQGELVTELREELVRLRGRDALAQMKIATLSTQVAEFARAGVVVVWDPEAQRGVIQLANLQQAGEGKDYQLWVIDPRYPAPVNGGVLPVEASGSARLLFHPDQPVASVNKFAISVERAGGVAKAEGPIVFIGD